MEACNLFPRKSFLPRYRSKFILEALARRKFFLIGQVFDLMFFVIRLCHSFIRRLFRKQIKLRTDEGEQTTATKCTIINIVAYHNSAKKYQIEQCQKDKREKNTCERSFPIRDVQLHFHLNACWISIPFSSAIYIL